MKGTSRHPWTPLLVVALSLAGSPARADVVTDWSVKSAEIMAAARLPSLAAYRAMAISQSAVYEAVNAITARYPPNGSHVKAAPDASVDAAVVTASRVVLLKLAPSAQAAVDAAAEASLSAIADGSSKAAGIAVGKRAAAIILAERADDDAGDAESYRPRTTAGAYVPTPIPDGCQWLRRKPWVMTNREQCRPGPPPGLASGRWARDYHEVKALGVKESTRRSAEQTAIARFWDATGPMLYYPVVWSVTGAAGREATQNARLLAMVGQAVDDAIIAAFEAKYHYEFWRPITAIRNGDLDDNRATERDPSWTPLIETPLHPEYPCAHCIVAGAMGAVLQAEIGDGPVPTLRTSSAGATRTWTKIDDFVQEVAEARICSGVHFRTSTEVAIAMGKQIGALVVAKFPPSAH